MAAGLSHVRYLFLVHSPVTTPSQRDRQKDTETETKTDKDTNTQIHIHTHTHTHTHTHRCPMRYPCWFLLCIALCVAHSSIPIIPPAALYYKSSPEAQHAGLPQGTALSAAVPLGRLIPIQTTV